MGKLKLAKENITKALNKLHEALEHFEELKSMGKKQASVFMDNKELEESLRDSLIQRFEFCVDLFWKYLKKYEEEELGLTLQANAPRPIVTTACKAKIISEADGELLLEMIKSRNFTSHIYKEEIADQISMQIPEYYTVMRKYIDQLKIK